MRLQKQQYCYYFKLSTKDGRVLQSCLCNVDANTPDKKVQKYDAGNIQFPKANYSKIKCKYPSCL